MKKENAVESKEVGNYTVSVFPDDSAESPRDWDNMGHMVCFHGRYELGDKTDLKTDDFNSWGELQEHLVKVEGAVVILPLFLYDHSGLRMKVGSFQGLLSQGHAEFDSGQVGFIYATKKDILDNFLKKKLTKKLIAQATKNLESEVKTYDQYLCGDVYGYQVDGPDGEHADSCWGYYGVEDAMAEGVSVAESHIEDDRKAKQTKVKALIKNHVPLEARAAAVKEVD